jgi:hypothetical protein
MLGPRGTYWNLLNVNEIDGISWPPYAKGEVLVSTNTEIVKLLPASTDGLVLTSDSSTTEGVRWATNASGNIYTVDGTLTGDRLFSGGGHNLTMSQIQHYQVASTGSWLGRILAADGGTHSITLDAANSGAGGATIDLSAKTSVNVQGWSFLSGGPNLQSSTSGPAIISKITTSAVNEVLTLFAFNLGTGGAEVALGAKTRVRVADPLKLDSKLLDITSSAGAAGQVLTSTGGAVSWAGAASLGSINLATSTVGTDVVWSAPTVGLGGTATLIVPDADDVVARGVVNTGTQTFGGPKTFTSITTFNAMIQMPQAIVNYNSVIGGEDTIPAGGGLGSSGSLFVGTTLGTALNAGSSSTDLCLVGNRMTWTPTDVSSTVAVGNNITVTGGTKFTIVGESANASADSVCVFGTGASGTFGGGVAIGASAGAAGMRGISIGLASSVTDSHAITIGALATSAGPYYVQLGDATNSTTSAQCRFRSQIVSRESWIGGGSTTATIDNAGNITRTPSDARLKTEIVDLPVEDSFKFVRGCRPRQFRYNDMISDSFGKEARAGLVAQEVDEVFPALVNHKAYEITDPEAIRTAVKAHEKGVISTAEKDTAINAARRIYMGLKDSEIVFHLLNVVKKLDDEISGLKNLFLRISKRLTDLEFSTRSTT